MPRLTVLLLALASGLAPGCTCGQPAPPPAEESQAVEAPVPAPDGLLAELLLATPNATWGRIQRGVGGAAGILPATLGGVVCALAGIDANLGPEIDGAAPVVGALADSAGPAPAPGATPKVGWAIAVKLGEPRRARDVLLDGDTARYSARAVGTMTALVPKGGSLPIAAALARGGYLVLARTDADLERIGPYVYRTLPTKPPLAPGALVVDVPSSALKGPMRSRIGAMWEGTRKDLASKDETARAQHGGRAPDYADPQAILAMLDGVAQEKLGLLGDLDGARLVVDALDANVRADLTLTPNAGDGAARKALTAMHPGDATPLLGDADSPLALMFRDDAAGRAKTAEDVEGAIKTALGARLGDAEGKRLHGAIDGWTKARGDWTTLGLIGIEGLYVRAPAASGEAAERAIKDAIELASAAPFKQALRLRDVTTTANSAQIAYGDPPPKGSEGRKAVVVWSTKGGEISVTLQGPTGAGPSAKKLGDEPNVAGPLHALEGSVTFAAVVQPLKLDKSKASMPAAPLVIAWGKNEKSALLHLDASDVLVRELLKSQMGL